MESQWEDFATGIKPSLKTLMEKVKLIVMEE